MKAKFVLALAAAALLAAIPAQAITFGQADEGRHPNVGALLVDFPGDDIGPTLVCSGTLIEPDVFLTAAHCVDFLPSVGVSLDEVLVSFDEDVEPVTTSTTLFSGTAVPHPDFGEPGNDAHDVAVVLLEAPVAGVAPAQLPEVGLLDRLKRSGAVKSQRFTAVGYGVAREDERGGPHSLFFDGLKRFALQSFKALQGEPWLLLSMNPSTGDGGTCFGDSGGPHFLGGETSNLVVSLTVTGDRFCRATDKTYRLDTASAHAFLDDFVSVPA
jgi:secreted trypsin-like serine protease